MKKMYCHKQVCYLADAAENSLIILMQQPSPTEAKIYSQVLMVHIHGLAPRRGG